MVAQRVVSMAHSLMPGTGALPGSLTDPAMAPVPVVSWAHVVTGVANPNDRADSDASEAATRERNGGFREGTGAPHAPGAP